MLTLRDGGVYETPEGLLVVARAAPGGGYAFYALEEAGAGEGAGPPVREGRPGSEMFTVDAEGRLYRHGRPTDWRFEQLGLFDTGRTVPAG